MILGYKVMANKSREMIKGLMPQLSEVKGSVNIPAEFDNVSIFSNMQLSDYILKRIEFIREGQEVVPEYTDIKEKFAGMLFGFYINHSVRQQNELNKRYADVCEEFKRISEERSELNKKIIEVANRLRELEEAKGGKA